MVDRSLRYQLTETILKSMNADLAVSLTPGEKIREEIREVLEEQYFDFRYNSYSSFSVAIRYFRTHIITSKNYRNMLLTRLG